MDKFDLDISLVKEAIEWLTDVIEQWNEMSRVLREYRELSILIESTNPIDQRSKDDEVDSVQNKIRDLEARKLKVKHNVEFYIDTLVHLWPICNTYNPNPDTSLNASMDVFQQVVRIINRAFRCEQIINQFSTVTGSTETQELCKQLAVECFARLFTFAYSSTFILALTELFVSVFSGRLNSQSQIQQTANREHQITTTAGGASATSESSHAESIEEQSSLLIRDAQLACVPVIRYTIDAGMNYLIDDVRKATQKILSRIPLEQMLDIDDLICYCSGIRRLIEKGRYHSADNPHPLLKYVRSNSFLPSRTNSQPPATSTTAAASASSYSFSNVLSSASSFSSTCEHPSPSVFNDQQQFEMDCIEMIESVSFQRVLPQIIEQSFNNIYAEFARKLVEASAMTTSQQSTEMHLDHSTVLTEPQLPFAKIVPISNNIYSKLSTPDEQLMRHFRILARQPELHDFTKYAYNLFSKQSSQSASRTADSFFPSTSSSST